jgi:hypothetical protein
MARGKAFVLQFLHPHNLTMPRFSPDLADFRAIYGFKASNFFTTTNPKTGKNTAPTLVLHLEPLTYGSCPAAGSCASLCLHKAGNPAALPNKIQRRRKRSLAWHISPARFTRLLVIEAARFAGKGYKGVRLNGTSDIAWEDVPVQLDALDCDLVNKLSGVMFMPGRTYSVIEAMTMLGLLPYDYTKRVDRDFKLCAELGYHLTLSWGGKNDDVVFEVAKAYRLNVAAGIYGVRKGKSLPDSVQGYPVIDGDVTDWRRSDPSDQTYVVGLRIKRTPGQTQEQARRFALA